jgi:hypothetical protein
VPKSLHNTVACVAVTPLNSHNISGHRTQRRNVSAAAKCHRFLGNGDMAELISFYIENHGAGNKLANQTRSGFERTLRWLFASQPGARFQNRPGGTDFQPFV